MTTEFGMPPPAAQALTPKHTALAQHFGSRAPMNVLAIDYDGIVRFANDYAFYVLGYPPNQDLTMSLAEIDVDFSLPRCRERWAHLRQLSDRAVSYDRVAQRKDGSLISLEVVASYSEAGGVGYVFTYFRDVEERLQVEATLREARVEHERAQRIGHVGHWRR